MKQRQEKQNHHSACLNTSHAGPCQAAIEEEIVTSLWPDIDQIQSIQVDDMLPICAFGELVPAMEARYIPITFKLKIIESFPCNSSVLPFAAHSRYPG